jgi:hypothetical protein
MFKSLDESGHAPARWGVAELAVAPGGGRGYSPGAWAPGLRAFTHPGTVSLQQNRAHAPHAFDLIPNTHRSTPAEPRLERGFCSTWFICRQLRTAAWEMPCGGR